MKTSAFPLPFPTLSIRLKLILAAGLFLSAPSARAADRPNILFIYTDDHSYRTVSCYPEAHKWVSTPNIDALAEQGVRFEYAYIGTWCMPSRATLLTGLHSYGVQSMRMEGKYPGSEYDAEQCHFWPSVFRKNGYQTAHIGKWHTGTDTGYGRDWDYQIVWNRPRFPENSGNYYSDQLIEKNGGEAKMVKGYSTDKYTDWALDYISGREGRDPEKPWYLWLCYGGVHGPYTPADRHMESYPDASVTPPADVYGPRPEKPAYLDRTQAWVKGADGQPHVKAKNGKEGQSLTSAVQQYNQAVLALDEGIGRVIQGLKDSGQYENTLIVFTSDQGFAWGQHGFRSKLAPYDATIRSPMIVSMPAQLPSGKVCPHPVGGPDLIPTFFHFAGIDLPWEMHGHDLTPLLENPEGDWDHGVMTILTGASYGADCDRVPSPKEKEVLYRGGGVPWWVSFREGRYKYVRTLIEGEMEELYDMETDPEELENLALESGHQKTLEKFRQSTIDELHRTGAKMADHLPAVGTQAQ